MDIIGVTNEELQNRRIAEEREFRDRCAIAAMQSLIKAYIVFDGSGGNNRLSKDYAFSSLASDAMGCGWGSESDMENLSIAGRLAWDAYAIADAMLIERDKGRDEKSAGQATGEDDDAEATEKTAGS